MIKKEEIKKDNFVDAVFKTLREFQKHRGAREQKSALHESLVKTLVEHRYEPFLGTETEFATCQIGESYLFDVPSTRHGPLSKFKGKQIDRFTLGIIGFGRVGKNINSQLKSSVNKILFYDNKAVNFPNKQRNLERSASLDDLLSNSDAIFICAKEQLNGESLINKHNIKNLKQGSYIINTSRGSLLEFDACYKALIEGRIAGLALDVFEGEESGILPKKSILESIYTHNLIITPHIAGNTKEAWELSEEIIAKKILKFVNK